MFTNTTKGQPMTTLYFTRQFTKGTLVGLRHHDQISFPTVEGCMRWLKAVKANSRKLDYIVVDVAFQKFAR
jgi:hypothetical protein